MEKQGIALVWMGLLLSASAAAQALVPGQPLPDRGVVPGRTFDTNDIESISIESGSLLLHIPLASLPPSPGGSAIALGMTYNSQIFDVSGGFIALPSTLGGGWSYNFNYSLNPVAITTPLNGACSRPFALSVQFPDGSQHALALNLPGDPGTGSFFGSPMFYDIDPSTGAKSAQQCTSASVPNPLVYYTTDSTSTRVEVTTAPILQGDPTGCSNDSSRSWVIYLPDGRRVFGTGFLCSQQVTQIKDRNNNAFTFTYANETNLPTATPTVTITDALNRSITLTYAVDPLAQTTPPVDTVTAPGPNSTTLSTTVNWASTQPSYQVSYACSPPPPGTSPCTTSPVSFGVGSIQLPPSSSGNLQYGFQYNSNDTDRGWGELKNMTLPYGAQVQYTYANTAANPFSAILEPFTSNPITIKLLSYKDSTGTQRTETWQYGQWNFTDATKPKLVTNPDGGVTTYYQAESLPSNGGPALRIREVIQPNGDVIDRTWRENCAYLAAPAPDVTLSYATGNSYVSAEFHTVQSSLGVKTSTQLFKYDRNGNLLGQNQYDFVPLSTFQQLGTESSGSPVSAAPSGAFLLKSSAMTFGFNASASDDGAVDSGCAAQTFNQVDDAQAYWHSLESTSGGAATLTSRLSLETDNSSGAETRTDDTFDNPLTTANVTTEYSWDSTKSSALSLPLSSSNSIVTSHTYTAGVLSSSTDPNGVPTTYTYNLAACGSGGQGASPTAVTRGLLTTNFGYDCTTGLLTSTTDPNGVVTTRAYDSIGRLTTVCEVASAASSTGSCTFTSNDSTVGSRTFLSYAEAPGGTTPLVITTANDLLAPGNGGIATVQALDQLGQIASTTRGDTTVQHLGPLVSGGATYEATANPQFSSGDATAGWTRTTRDTMGRATSVSYFTGGALPSPWGSNNSPTATATTRYDGYSAIVTDESGNSRQQIVDGAGRLVTVVEDPGSGSTHLNYSTCYNYDARDNLIFVGQGGQITGSVCQGGLTRSFGYTSLGRLSTANNPETNGIQYVYDGNGNLIKKTDARGVSIYYGYDALNRLGAKQYSDGTTPQVTMCYGDGVPSPTSGSISWSCSGAPSGSFMNERLTMMTTGPDSQPYSQSKNTTFDELGRIRASQQTTNGTQYVFSSYGYIPDGSIKSMTMPSGRQLTWMYDSSARPNGVSGTLGRTATNYASVTTFWPSGAPNVATLAIVNGVAALSTTASYDARLRPTALTLTGSGGIEGLTYAWNANGNLQQEQITNPQISATTVTQTFSYDSVNRLIAGVEAGGSSEWNQYFGYDQYGNRSLLTSSNFIPYAGVTPQAPQPVSPWTRGQTLTTGPFSNNRYTGATSDSAGNAQTDSTLSSASTAAYDAENRLQTVTGLGMGVLQYYYDGNGNRVMKVVCASTPCSPASSGAQVGSYVYDASGQLAAEYGTSGTVNGTQYFFTDNLGSTRVLASSSGAFTRCYDYAPFGEPLAGTGSRGNCYNDISMPSGTQGAETIQFTSKERDAETGLDWFNVRYFSSAQGRFTSPDDPFAGNDASDPQSWNLFSYGRNNPLMYTDPTGHDVTCSGDSDNFKCVDNAPPAQPPQVDTTPSTPPPLLINVLTYTIQGLQPTLQMGHDLWNFISAPRNSTCLAGATAAGSVAGTGVGALAGGGVFSLPGAALGFGIGGAGGYGAGMISCMSSPSGPSSGGEGGDSGKNGWTNKAARDKASQLGFKEVKGARSHGQLVFKSGSRSISPDVDGHSGYQTWKVFDSSGNRIGTFNTDLTVQLGK